MECLNCGGQMQLREVHPLCMGGGIVYRLDFASLVFACEVCCIVTPAPAPRPAEVPAPAPAAG